MTKRSILVAPLNWGLGHATRCIPIIEELLKEGFEPVIASDGAAFSLLKKEFPQLQTEELPSYYIEYPEDGGDFRLSLIRSLPKIRKAIAQEKLRTDQICKKYELQGIISDNRLGVRSNAVPSVVITHQLNVLTGKTTFFSSLLHHFYLRKFDECWIPDFEVKPNLSGKLGLNNFKSTNTKYIGPLSRLKFHVLEKRYDLLVLLSGPEPQRTILENLLLEKLKEDKRNILFVRGIMDGLQAVERIGNMKIYNFLLSHQLENAINSSEIVLCRSGYTSIMDLAKLKKKAFFIPTPGQYEQEYLAQRFQELGIAPFSKQENFQLKLLNETAHFSGFGNFKFPNGLKSHFALFKVKENSLPTPNTLST